MEATIATTTRFGRAYLTTDSTLSSYNQPVLAFEDGGEYVAGQCLPTGISAALYVEHCLDGNDPQLTGKPVPPTAPLSDPDAVAMCVRFIRNACRLASVAARP